MPGVNRLIKKNIWFFIFYSCGLLIYLFLILFLNQKRPKIIYGSENSKSRGEVGFDMRYSNQGMWGVGIYFAENASYSNGYAYDNRDGSKSFFYAKVAIGQSVPLPSDNKLRVPPLKSTTNGKLEESYDSIQGYTGNSNIFIIYENSRAYPQYLITYKS